MTSGMLNLNDDDLYELARQRNSLPADDPRQAQLAPQEHGQFTQEVVRDRPWMALPLAAATPAYTAGKAAGLIDARSPASLSEISEAYKGIMRGLSDWWNRPSPAPAAPSFQSAGMLDYGPAHRQAAANAVTSAMHRESPVDRAARERYEAAKQYFDMMNGPPPIVRF